jgi:phenylacetate-CoA ligase
MGTYRQYWDAGIETLPSASLRRLQEERLQTQLDYLFARSAFYGKKLGATGIRRQDLTCLEDLVKLPVTMKDEVRRSQEETPPFGDLVAADLADVVRMHTSSGTTGRPTCMLWTRQDLQSWADMYARQGWAVGLRPTDVFMNGWSTEWFVGGQGALMGFSHLGALTIPAGSRDSRRLVHALREYGVHVMSGTPSFLLHLSEIAQAEGVAVSDLKLHTLCLGGEPGASIPATREKLEELWHARPMDVYGSLEFQPIAWECRDGGRLHFCEDQVYVEVLHPDSLEPVAAGREGVLVLSHLDRRACPLLRWWTGDMVVASREPCPCGRTHLALVGGVRGRVDDMLIVRGVNVFPSAVEDVLRSMPFVAEEFQILIDRDSYDPFTRSLSKLKLRVELKPGLEPTAELAEKVTEEVRSRLALRPVVDLVPHRTLPRTTMKAQRIIRTV